MYCTTTTAADSCHHRHSYLHPRLIKIASPSPRRMHVPDFVKLLTDTTYCRVAYLPWKSFTASQTSDQAESESRLSDVMQRWRPARNLCTTIFTTREHCES